MKIKFSALPGIKLQKCSFAMLMCFLAHVSDAQQLPNAGMLEKDAERTFKSLPPLKSQPKEIVKPQLNSTASGGVSVEVTRFKFNGNRLLSEETLGQALVQYLKKPLDFSQLQDAAGEVMNAYRKAGWMVRAYLPKQEIEGGVVQIDIVEGVFGGTQVDSEPSNRIKFQRLLNIGNNVIEVGQAVRAVKIDRAILLMDDLPGISVSGNLVAGAKTGETNLSLQVTDDPLMDGGLSADNAGSISTGVSRLILNANLNSPSQMGDLLTGNLLKSEGSNYARVNYTLPLMNNGLRGGLHASALNYQLVGNFSSLGAKGTAYTGGLEASYPLIRSQVYNLNLTTNLDHKSFNNQANQSTTSQYVIDVNNWVLSGNSIDAWARGGMINYSLGVTRGRVNLDDSPNQLTDALSTQTAGLYTKANLNVSRLQTITPSLSLSLNFSAQQANRNLDSSEKIYLGGASAVRAYPSNEGGGSVGQTFSVELKQKVFENWSVSGFFDRGHVRVYQQNQDITGSALTALNDFSLSGAGMSLTWQSLRGTELKATVARRILDNPNANAKTGADSDGTLRLNRVWLNATVAF